MIGSDTIGLLLRIQGDGSQARKEAKETAADINKSVESVSRKDFSGQVDKEAKAIKSATSDALKGFAQDLGLSAEQTAALGAALPILGTAIVGIGVAAAGAAVSLFALANNASEYASKFKDLQEVTGLSIESLSALKFAGEQGGVGLDKISGATEKFSKLVGEAAKGSVEARDKLLAFGIEPQAALSDLDGALQKAFLSIAKMPEGIQQITAAQNLFGKSGADLLPLIKATNGNFAETIETAKKLGLVLSQADVDAGDAFGDTLATLKSQTESLSAQFALSFAPTITKVMGELSEYLGENQQKTKEFGNETNLALLGIISYWGKATEAAKGYYGFLAGQKGSDIGSGLTGFLSSPFTALLEEGKRVEETMRGVVDQSLKISTGIKDIPSLATQLEIDKAKKDAETLSKTFDSLTNKIAFFGQESEVAATKQSLIGAGITDLDSAAAKNLLALAATIDRLKDAKKAQENYNKEIKDWRKELDAFTDKSLTSIFPAQSELDRFNKWVKTTKADMSDLKEEVRLTRVYLEQAADLRAFFESVDRFTKLDKAISDITQNTEASTAKFTSLEDKLFSLAKALNLAETSFISLGKAAEESTDGTKNITDETFTKNLDKYLAKYRKESERYNAEVKAIQEQKAGGDDSDSLAIRESVNAAVRLENLEKLTAGLRTYLATLKTVDKDGKEVALFGDDKNFSADQKIDAFIQRLLDLDKAVGAASLKSGLEKLNAEIQKLGLNIGGETFKTDLQKLNELLSDPEINAALKERALQLGLTIEQLKEYIRLKAESDADPRSTGTRPRVVDDGLSGEVSKTLGNSSLVSIFGGLAGGGVEETDSTGKIKSQGEYLKDVYKDISESSNAAIGSMIGGLADLAQQWIQTGKFSVKAAAQMVAGILISLAIEDGVKALHEVAEGLALAANPLTAFLAPGHFAAASAYGIAAAATGAAGITLGALSHGGSSNAVTSAASSGSSNSSGSNSNDKDREIIESRRQAQEYDRQTTKDILNALSNIKVKVETSGKIELEAGLIYKKIADGLDDRDSVLHPAFTSHARQALGED